MEWVVTDNIYDETWRRLLEFANVDSAVEQIIARHGRPQDGDLSNYRKQAQQIRVCTLQAKEYFDAARASSLFTRPNHAYYGIVSLASMMMLLMGTGMSSLDVLRRDPKRNSHHGLNFSTGCTAKGAAKDLALIEQTFVSIRDSGHFANWYRTLPRISPIYGLVIRSSGPQGSTKDVEEVGHVPTPAFEDLVGEKNSLRELIKFLPDLSRDLGRYAIDTPRSRSDYRVEHVVPVPFDPKAATAVTHKWILHAAWSDADRETLLGKFAVDPQFANRLVILRHHGGRSAQLTLTQQSTEVLGLRWPNMRDSLDHESIMYAELHDKHEIVDLYLIGYQLSMLARYFPDLWINSLESQCRASKIIERAIDVIVRKFPILVLSTLTRGGMLISTHRPTYYD